MYYFIKTSQSSFIRAIFVEKVSLGKFNLIVLIKDELYRYYNVDLADVKYLSWAKSYGAYLNNCIKPKYQCRAVGNVLGLGCVLASVYTDTYSAAR